MPACSWTGRPVSKSLISLLRWSIGLLVIAPEAVSAELLDSKEPQRNGGGVSGHGSLVVGWDPANQVVLMHVPNGRLIWWGAAMSPRPSAAVGACVPQPGTGEAVDGGGSAGQRVVVGVGGAAPEDSFSAGKRAEKETRMALSWSAGESMNQMPWPGCMRLPC
jgi:hypothetical protein